MNRLREQSSLTLSSRYMLAMAYMLTGRKDIAAGLMNKTTELGYDYSRDLTFGSPLRDKSIVLLALMAAGRDAEAMALSNDIARELSSSSWYSTQTTAFALMAAAKQAERTGQGEGLDLTYECGRVKGTVSTGKHVWSATIVRERQEHCRPRNSQQRQSHSHGPDDSIGNGGRRYRISGIERHRAVRTLFRRQRQRDRHRKDGVRDIFHIGSNSQNTSP